MTFASLCFRCVVVHGLRIHSPGLSSAVHPFVWFVMNFASSCIRSSGLSRTSHHRVSAALLFMTFPSIRLVCHDFRIHSSGLSSAVHPLAWSVVRRASVRLVCHELHIVMYPFTRSAMIFTSPHIRSPGPP